MLFARSKWLKPGGAHFPSHAQIYMAPLQTNVHNNRIAEYKEEVDSHPTPLGVRGLASPWLVLAVAGGAVGLLRRVHGLF